MKLDELHLAALLDQARSWVQAEKPLHAVQEYLRLLRREPAFLPAYSELSSLYAEMGKFDAAARILLRAEPYAQHPHEITFSLGTLYMRAEEYDKALVCFKKLQDLHQPQVHFNLGVAYFCKNNIKRAEEQFRLTLKYDPRFPKIHESLGELLIKRNAYTEAVTLLKRGLELDPYNAVGHHLLGLAYRNLLNWKHAYNEFVVAIEMDPNAANNWRLCGEMLVELKRLDEAEQYLRKSLDLVPDSIDSLLVLSQLYSRKGDIPEARKLAEKVMNLNPGDARAKEILRGIEAAGKKTIQQ
jgi:tetratricopeptide (TPR) repeat protein